MLVFAGFCTGLLVGITGVGAGAMMTPLLLLVFGVAPVTAVGTDLLFAGLTKIVASQVHHKAGLIDWQVVRRLWLGSLPASALTVFAIKQGWLALDVSSLKQIIGYAVLITALGMIVQTRLNALGRRLRLGDADQFKRLQPLLTVFAGLLLGFLVTLTSVGAGAVGAVMLAYLYPLRLTPSRLVATDIVHAVPLALFAGSGHMLIGNVDFELLAWLLLGSVPGVWLGAKISVRMPQQYLRLGLAIVLATIGLKLTGLFL
jgi:uncharacterized membrane protein YfcA